MTTHTRTRGGRRTTKPQHGTESEYRRGCRCELCTAAMTAARRARQDRADRAQALEQARRELAALQKTPAQAGKVADVSRDVYLEYVVARQDADEAEKRLLLAELAFKQEIGDAEIVRVGRRRVATWGTFARTFFDQATFRAKHPGLWDRFQRTGTTRRFVVTMFAATPPQRRARAAAKGARR